MQRRYNNFQAHKFLGHFFKMTHSHYLNNKTLTVFHFYFTGPNFQLLQLQFSFYLTKFKTVTLIKRCRSRLCYFNSFYDKVSSACMIKIILQSSALSLIYNNILCATNGVQNFSIRRHPLFLEFSKSYIAPSANVYYGSLIVWKRPGTFANTKRISKKKQHSV